MRKILAWLPTHALYWIGHVASKIMNRREGFVFLYPLYNRCMMWSLACNDWGCLNLWTYNSHSDGDNG